MTFIAKSSIQKYIRRLTPIAAALAPAGNLMHEIQAVLFDIYGTLFISKSGDISLATHNSPQLAQLKLLLAKYDVSLAPRSLLDAFYGAIKTRHAELREKGIRFPEVKIDRIWGRLLQTDDQHAVRQFAAEFEWIVNPVYPMPYLADLLSTCRQQGLLLGIISNAQFYTPYLFKWFLGSMPQALGFNADLIFYSYKFEMAKPSAALFESAAQKLKEKGVAPASVLYVGNDMLNDIFPAQNTGFKTALFAGDKRSLRLRRNDLRCKSLKADLIVTDLSQLIGHIRCCRENRTA